MARPHAFMAWTQAAGAQSKDARLLHLLLVVPLPEDAGMVPRTYDTLKSLGQASAMPGQKTTYDAQGKSRGVLIPEMPVVPEKSDYGIRLDTSALLYTPSLPASMEFGKLCKSPAPVCQP